MPLDPVPPYPECGWYGGSISRSSSTTTTTRIGRAGSLDVLRSGSSEKYDRAVRCWFPGHVYEQDNVGRLSRNDAWPRPTHPLPREKKAMLWGDAM